MPTKKPTLYGVFIAIDEYGPNVSSLSGCKNDCIEYRKLLDQQFSSKIDIDSKNIQLLFDEEATYDKVIKAFDMANFSSMKKDDLFLFIYAGHGSRERQAKEFDQIAPEGQSETLVLHDSREPGGKDLADKEIAILLNRIGEHCDNITVIFDSCHSASGVRSINDIVLGKTRQAPDDLRNGLSRSAYDSNGHRSYDSYLDGYYKDTYGKEPKVPFTKLILLSACDKKEKAKELASPSHGAFSHFLVEAIRESPSINYLDLMDEVKFKLSQNYIDQNPRINPQLNFNTYNTFLLNQSVQSMEEYLWKENNQWILKRGAIHGLLLAEEVVLEIIEGDKVLGKGKVTAVHPEKSVVELEGIKIEDKDKLTARYIRPFSKPILINNLSEGVGQNKLQKALSTATPINFQIRENLNNSQYALKCSDERVSILDTENNKEIIAYKGTHEDQLFSFAFEDLEHIGQWNQRLQIENKACQFDPSEVEVTFTNLDSGETFTEQELIEIYLTKNNKEKYSFTFEISIKNSTPVTLNCSLLYFGVEFHIVNVYDNFTIPAGITAKFPLSVEKSTLHLPESKNEATDIFKIFITTSDFINTEKLKKNRLQRLKEYKKSGVVTVNKGSTRDYTGDTTANEGQREEYIDQWLSKTLRVKSIQKNLNLSQERIAVSDKVSISAPKGLEGDIITRIIPTTTRSLDEYSIVNQLVNRSEDAELLYFDSHRSISGTPNCLEIQHIKNQGILNDDPLVIEVVAADDTVMIPLTYDGEHFIPLDIKDAVEGKCTFELTHLPQRAGNRSLTQAIKLFFVKIRGEHTSKNTHQLKFVNFRNGQSSNNKDEFKSLVAKSKSPLLLVHGIIGNTKQMVQVARPLFDSGAYDLVMTFNYENLNTPIEATAGVLLEQLKAVGIGKDKQIAILSHSMGGLVSRCMIEQLAGHELVKKLVVVGTPNLGSKVAEVGSKYLVQWLPLIFFLINVGRKFSEIKKIFALASGKLKTDKTLNQMTWEDPDRWLKNLGNAPDPKIPYHVIYGDLDAYLAKNESQKRLMQKVYKLGGQLFYKNAPSDLIVSKDSMTGIPSDRMPTATITAVPSIHTSYFEDEASIDEIMKALQ